jgi:UDPglucose 6-dehydrogenase
MKETTIGIIGQGFVGNAIYQGFKDYYRVLTYDKYIDTKSNSGLKNLVINSDVIFSCVPTPMTDAGECFTGIVEDVLKEINDICEKENMFDQIVIIKSTVIPGTTKKMNDKFEHINVIFNPEFLTEANAVNDWKNQNRIILGGLNKVTAKVKPIFKKVFPQVPIVKTDSKYAEMVKYVINTFLATKVSFANEIYQLCKVQDIDYDKVIEYAQYDERLGKSHWSVPGPDGEFGFGGHCFPKDTQALMFESFKMGLTPIMLAATITKNDEVRGERDWEKMDGRAVIKTNNFKTVNEYASLEDMRNGVETPEPILDNQDLEGTDLEWTNNPNQLKLNI